MFINLTAMLAFYFETVQLTELQVLSIHADLDFTQTVTIVTEMDDKWTIVAQNKVHHIIPSVALP